MQRTEDQRIDCGTLAGFRIPKEVRVLMLDGKHFRIGRKAHTLYLAFDAERMRPLSWIFLPRHELRTGYDRMLRLFRQKSVAIPSVVSDGGTGIMASLQDHYPKAVHQRCAFHVMMKVRQKSGGELILRTVDGRAYWEWVRRIALKDASLNAARRHLRAALLRHPEKERALLVLGRSLPGIYEFPKYGPLKDFRTSNRIENCMGQIEARVKTMRGLKTPKTAAKMIAAILKTKYKDQPG